MPSRLRPGGCLWLLSSDPFTFDVLYKNEWCFVCAFHGLLCAVLHINGLHSSDGTCT